jgi:hypothetical protein
LLSDNPFDILAINETKIDSSILNAEIHIDNYTIVRFDRNRFGGGVALYIKNNIPYTERKDLVPDYLEMTCVEITRQHSKPLLIATWYRPPNSELDIFTNFELFLFKCDMENKELFLVGDLNCDVNKLAPDSQTHKLQNLCSLYQLTQVINEPTRITETTSTLIDLILTNKPEYISTVGVLHLGISDHSLLYAVSKFELPKSRPTIKEVRDFKHFSESQFRADLLQVPWDTICYDDPNTCWIVWKSIFYEILNKHAPVRTKANSVPWITPAIKRLMRNRDYHKKKAIRFISSIHWDKYKSLRNRVNKQMRKSKIDVNHREIGDCTYSNDFKKIWSLINSLKGITNLPVLQIISVNDNSITDSMLIAETFNELALAYIGPSLASEASEEPLTQHTTNSFNNSNPTTDTIFHFHRINVENIFLALMNLKINKSTGLDKIPANVLSI